MKNYGKILLYSYGKLKKLSLELGKLAESKAMAAFYSPYGCEKIAENIIKLYGAKETVDKTRKMLNAALKHFTPLELEYLEHRYFKIRVEKRALPVPKDRAYFREQRRLYVKFCKCIKKEGLTEEWFDGNCLKLRFFSDMCELYAESRL